MRMCAILRRRGSTFVGFLLGHSELAVLTLLALAKEIQKLTSSRSRRVSATRGPHCDSAIDCFPPLHFSSRMTKLSSDYAAEDCRIHLKECMH